MTNQTLSQSRFWVGVILLVVAALMFLGRLGDIATAGAVAFAVLGLASIAISRRR